MRLWRIETLSYWVFAILRLWRIETLSYWVFAMLRLWRIETLSYWVFDILRLWHRGIDASICWGFYNRCTLYSIVSQPCSFRFRFWAYFVYMVSAWMMHKFWNVLGCWEGQCHEIVDLFCWIQKTLFGPLTVRSG